MKGLEIINKAEFGRHAVWRFDEDSDLLYPVDHPDDMPDNPRDVQIRAVFFTPIGEELEGHIVGIDNVFCIGIFVNEETIFFNKNLPDMVQEEFERLRLSLKNTKIESVNDLFPLRFETRFDWEDLGYQNFWGEFDALEKVRS